MDKFGGLTTDLGMVATGTHLIAQRSYWGDMIHDGEANEDLVFEVMGAEPSKAYPADGIVLKQISGPTHELLDDDYSGNGKSELNLSPIHVVGLDESCTEYTYVVAFVVERSKTPYSYLYLCPVCGSRTRCEASKSNGPDVSFGVLIFTEGTYAFDPTDIDFDGRGTLEVFCSNNQCVNASGFAEIDVEGQLVMWTDDEIIEAAG